MHQRDATDRANLMEQHETEVGVNVVESLSNTETAAALSQGPATSQKQIFKRT